MRSSGLLLCLMVLAIIVRADDDISLSASGMTVLKAVYGASCGMRGAISEAHSHLTDYVKGICDGSDYCSGTVDPDVVEGEVTDCEADFHVVAVCEHGEIRSFSLPGESVGHEFFIDCTEREILAERHHADWMGDMEDVLSNRTIKDLRLAGSHHSGTHTFSMFLYHLAKCQSIRVGQQLLAGVRYLDYRLGAVDGSYGARVIHGIIYGQQALGDLLEIWAFSKLHPREFFIVDLQHTSTLTRRMQRQLRGWLRALFRRTAINRWSVILTEHRMRDIWDSGRRILFLHDKPVSYLVWSRNVLHSRWPNVCTGETLAANAENELARLDNYEHHLVMVQWLITVQFSCLTSLYGRSLDIREEGMRWLREHDHPFTIVLTDFTLHPLNEAGLVEQLIQANIYQVDEQTV